MTAKSIPLDELCDDSQDAELEVCPGRVEEERVTEETKVKPHVHSWTAQASCVRSNQSLLVLNMTIQRGDEINYIHERVLKTIKGMDEERKLEHVCYMYDTVVCTHA